MRGSVLRGISGARESISRFLACRKILRGATSRVVPRSPPPGIPRWERLLVELTAARRAGKGHERRSRATAGHADDLSADRFCAVRGGLRGMDRSRSRPWTDVVGGRQAPLSRRGRGGARSGVTYLERRQRRYHVHAVRSGRDGSVDDYRHPARLAPRVAVRGCSV